MTKFGLTGALALAATAMAKASGAQDIGDHGTGPQEANQPIHTAVSVNVARRRQG